ncbi:hypothetical protein AVEN_126017-1, partial [Araneus ventricosus]
SPRETKGTVRRSVTETNSERDNFESTILQKCPGESCNKTTGVLWDFILRSGVLSRVE